MKFLPLFKMSYRTACQVCVHDAGSAGVARGRDEPWLTSCRWLVPGEDVQMKYLQLACSVESLFIIQSFLISSSAPETKVPTDHFDRQVQNAESPTQAAAFIACVRQRHDLSVPMVMSVQTTQV